MKKPNESLIRFLADNRASELEYKGADFFLNDEKISSSKELNQCDGNGYLEDAVVCLDGDRFPFKSFLWFVMNGSWHDEFINVDGKEGSNYYFDLLPANYEIEKCDYSLVELENFFEFAEENGHLFWWEQNRKSSLWNNTFMGKSAVKIFGCQWLVEIFGKFYSYDEVISIMGIEPSSDGEKDTSSFVSAGTTEENSAGRRSIAAFIVATTQCH